MDDFKKFASVSEGRITKVVGKTGMLSLKGKQLQAAGQCINLQFSKIKSTHCQIK